MNYPQPQVRCPSRIGPVGLYILALCSQLLVLATLANPVLSAQMDLSALERRLVKTRAVGIFTKLTLKQHADSFTEAMQDFHEGNRSASLAELRQRYNILIQEVVVVVQKKDPELARDISAAREVVWLQLVDKSNFT